MGIGVDTGGGHVPTTIYHLNFVPTTFKMCKPIATEKIPTYSTEAVKSKSCDRICRR